MVYLTVLILGHIHTYVYICLTVNSYLLSNMKFGFNFIIRQCTSNFQS